jgi:hypothetical protein
VQFRRTSGRHRTTRRSTSYRMWGRSCRTPTRSMGQRVSTSGA